MTPHAEGVVVAVYVQPRASRTVIAGIHDGRLKVALRAPPVDGKANVALLRYLALVLEVPKRDVSMLAGATGRRKRILVKGVTLAEVASRLALSEVE